MSETAHESDNFAALNPQGSAWVGANAGAGKTYILVSRLARLMLDGVSPERILCLTYTRAAAAEMQDRLFELLGQWALMEDPALAHEISDRLGCAVDDAVVQRARILFARALETPGGLRVQTIHGFCESLLKRFPLEAGLSPHFDLLDEQEARSLQAGLIVDLLADRHETDDNARLMQAMAKLTRALAEPDIMSLARQIIDRRALFEKTSTAHRLAELAKAMGLVTPLPQAEILLADFHASSSALLKQIKVWLAGGSKTDQQHAARLEAWLKSTADTHQANWPQLTAVFFKQDGSPRASFATKGRVSDNPALAEKLDDFLAPVEALDKQLKALANYHLTEAVYIFAEALLSAYQSAKTRRAVLDYEDMISVTNRLLSGPQAAQWVLYKIDNGLHHILIDEAQDTSPAQWQIISALADAFFDDAGLTSADDTARTIFAVGDEKQSIFSFQGADPKGFDAQRQYFQSAIEAINGSFSKMPLLMSRRSAPQILHAVDLVFAAHAAGVTADGAPVRHEAHRDAAVGHVEIWPPCASDAAGEAEAAWQIPNQKAVSGRHVLADKMAEKIAALIADKKQNVTAGDILVLVRTRDVFVSALTRALKRKNIAIAGSDRMVLLEQIAVADILVGLDVALNPTDDMGLAIFLRSPLGGFSEEQLFALAHQRTGSLWQALKESAAQDEVATAAYTRLSWLREKVDFLSPYEVLAQFLGAQGGHKLLSARLGPEIDDPLGELLRLALAYEAKQAASMQGFLHWLRQGSQEIKRDMEAGGGAVRIMTVHGAKGLEAPIVFLPDTCRPAKKRGGGSDRVQFDAAKNPLWRANQALRDPYNAAQAQAAEEATAEEEKRLLYVAMTRARERLYIAGWLGAREKAAPADSWYAMIDGALDETARANVAGGEMALPRSKEDDETLAFETGDISAPPAWVSTTPKRAASGEAYIGTKIFSPSGLAANPPSSSSPMLSENAEAAMQRAALRGKLVHKLLEVLPQLAAEKREAAGENYLRHHAGDFDAAAQSGLLDEAMRVMALPALADLFSGAARAEAPIAGLLGLSDGKALTLSGQIDRMVETDAAIILVDFKTGRPPEDTVIAASYMTQMAAYRALMQAASGNEKPVTCALIWTQSGQVEWLSEADMAASLEALSAGRVRL